MIESSNIKKCALEQGFDLVGITMPRQFEVNRRAIEQWIASGAADSVEYMQRYMDLRFNPANLMEGTRSVVVCAINYKSPLSLHQNHSTLPKIASYALNPDYHKVVRRTLRALLRALQQLHPSLQGRCCVDSAPLLEKQLAVEAGLGWIGRQSLLITPQFGSYIVLGVLLLDDVVDTYDTPLQGLECGSCHRCITHCPTAAILNNRMVDTRRCISALTIETDNTTCEDLHGWIFGCDQCQSCCPHNQKTPLATNPQIKPIFNPITKQEWHEMTPEEFTLRLAATPLKRGGLERILRNL